MQTQAWLSGKPDHLTNTTALSGPSFVTCETRRSYVIVVHISPVLATHPAKALSDEFSHSVPPQLVVESNQNLFPFHKRGTCGLENFSTFLWVTQLRGADADTQTC